jgi:hypothetical protein
MYCWELVYYGLDGLIQCSSALGANGIAVQALDNNCTALPLPEWLGILNSWS